MSVHDSPTRKAFKRLRKNRLAMCGLVWMIFISSLAIFADVIAAATGHPSDIHLLEHKVLPPSFWEYSEEDQARLKLESFPGKSEAESSQLREEILAHNDHNINQYWFGTDVLGYDLFIRVIYGGRVSLSVAIICTAVALIIGVVWGSIAGFFGGWLDEFMMRFVDIIYALPYILFVIMVMTIFNKSEALMFACIGMISWLTMSRIVRGEVISLKEREFVTAALAMGASGSHLIQKHIVPNILGVVIVYATLMVPQIILTEAFLSFLGMGIQPPKPSWGNLMTDGATLAALQHHQWLLIFPGITLSLTLLALNFLGDGLRDAFDPRQT